MDGPGLFAALRDAFRLGARSYREELAHLDLTPRQAALLVAIRSHPGHGVKFAAGQIGADVPTCSALVARLVERGLVERRAHPGDRRRTMLYVTSEAVALIETVERARAVADRRLAAAAGSDLPRLLRLLERLSERLSEPAEVATSTIERQS